MKTLNGLAMAVRRWAFLAAALMILLAVGTAVVAEKTRQRGGCDDSDQARERCEAAARQHRQERMHRYCAENPHDERCVRMAAHDAEHLARHATRCADHPDEPRCQQDHPAPDGNRRPAYCHEHPDEPRCQRHDDSGRGE